VTLESLSRDVKELTDALREHCTADQRRMQGREEELQDWLQKMNGWLAIINHGVDDLRGVHTECEPKSGRLIAQTIPTRGNYPSRVSAKDYVESTRYPRRI